MDSKEEAPYTLFETNQCFYLRCLTTGAYFCTVRGSLSKMIITSSSNSYLSISRSTNKIIQLTPQEYQTSINNSAMSQLVKFYLLMGTIIINQEPYLLLATNAEEVAVYIEHPIFRVTEIKFMPYRRKRYQKQQDLQEEEKVIELLKDYISNHFYFSYRENITNSLTGRPSEEIHKFQFNLFAWNHQLLQPFLRRGISSCWTVPVIQGFVAEISTQNMYFGWKYLSISRRSIFMAGTRFNSRGLDQSANASNFVETQEIIKYLNNLYVHVSVRGSVPLFWRQAKVRGAINFVKDKHIDQQTMLKTHYANLEERYLSKVLTINLLSRQKSPQKQLKNRFEALFNRNIERPYLFFDLNQVMESSVNGQFLISRFVLKNDDTIFGEIAFSILQNVTLQVKQVQSILPRVNCLDCLDRTNVMMARVSETFILKAVKHINKEVDIAEKRINIDNEFVDKLMKLWTQLGDCISEIYCGTASVAAHMTRKQNNSLISTLGGAVTSLNRYLNAVRSDLFKQKCIDSLLVKDEQSNKTAYFQQNISLQLPQELYSTYKEIKIGIVTFNTAEINPMNLVPLNWQKFLQSAGIGINELIVFNFQQVFFFESWVRQMQKIMEWKEYSLLTQVYSEKSKLLSIVFTSKSQTKFKFIQMIEIPLKSYGGLALFVQANHSLICVVNCRLQSGHSNCSLRIDDFNQLHTYLFKQTYRSRLLRQAKAIFLAGDFNLRLSNNIQKEFKYKNIVQEIYKREVGSRGVQDVKLINEALVYDQLPLLRKSNYYLYCQADINFFPTYKFYPKKTGYDRAKIPGWCDRIFFAESGYPNKQRFAHALIQCESYQRIDEKLGSYHKGVAGSFKISIKSEDQQLKKKLLRQKIQKD